MPWPTPVSPRCRQTWRRLLGDGAYREWEAVSDEELADRFAALAARWKGETNHLSDTELAFSHPIYQRIIAAGREAVPLIAPHFSEAPLDWGWALEEIAGPDAPRVPQSATLTERIAAWEKWLAP